MDILTQDLNGKMIVLIVLAVVVLGIVLSFRLAPKTYRPLAHRFGKTGAPEWRELGQEATDIDEVARVSRQNGLLGIRNEGRGKRWLMPDGNVPVIRLNDADYAKTFQTAFGRNPRGPSND